MTPHQDINKVKTWILHQLTGTITETERQLLEHWANERPQNKELLDRVLSSAFMRKAVLDSNKTQMKNTWSKLYCKIGYTAKYKLNHLQWLVAATITGILAGGAFLWNLHQTEKILAGSSKAFFYTVDSIYLLNGEVLNYAKFRQQKVKRIINSANLTDRVVVPKSGEYKVLLADSTLIHLGPESALIIPADFSKENRNIRISGEAYLKVHKDSLHPFYIDALKTHIRVLGTELNVKDYEDETLTHVTLVNGKADLVFNDAEPIILLPGETICMNQNGAIIQNNITINECTAWHHGRICFESRPLSEIMKNLERWYNMKVIFQKEELKNYCITMDLNKYDSFERLAQSINKMNEICIRIEKNNVVYISDNELNHNNAL